MTTTAVVCWLFLEFGWPYSRRPKTRHYVAPGGARTYARKDIPIGCDRWILLYLARLAEKGEKIVTGSARDLRHWVRVRWRTANIMERLRRVLSCHVMRPNQQGGYTKFEIGKLARVGNGTFTVYLTPEFMAEVAGGARYPVDKAREFSTSPAVLDAFFVQCLQLQQPRPEWNKPYDLLPRARADHKVSQAMRERQDRIDEIWPDGAFEVSGVRLWRKPGAPARHLKTLGVEPNDLDTSDSPGVGDANGRERSARQHLQTGPDRDRRRRTVREIQEHMRMQRHAALLRSRARPEPTIPTGRTRPDEPAGPPDLAIKSPQATKLEPQSAAVRSIIDSSRHLTQQLNALNARVVEARRSQQARDRPAKATRSRAPNQPPSITLPGPMQAMLRSGQRLSAQVQAMVAGSTPPKPKAPGAQSATGPPVKKRGGKLRRFLAAAADKWRPPV